MPIIRYIRDKNSRSAATDTVIYGKGRQCTFSQWTKIRLSNQKKRKK